MSSLSLSSSAARISLLLAVVAIAFQTVTGHGVLSVPAPRKFSNPDTQNEPLSVPWGNNMKCKNLPSKTPTLTLNAGSKLPVRWDFSANHKGDCFMYLSYDGGTKWFKIAQWAKCNEKNHITQSMTIPSYLPSCTHCIMRWEWYALHFWPKIELYVECVDVKIVGSSSGQLPSPQVIIPGHLPLNGGTASAPKYRNEYNRNMAFFFTGPRIATISSGSSSPTPSPTPTPTPTPTTSSGGTAIQIVQRYNIAYSLYQGDPTALRTAFINYLAYTSIPRLDPDLLSIKSVASDGRGVKVTFVYRPDSAALVVTESEVSMAIAGGHADNTTESMELDTNLPAEVTVIEDTGVITDEYSTTSSTSDSFDAVGVAAPIGAGVGGLVLGIALGALCMRRQRNAFITKKEQPTVPAEAI